MPAQEFAVDSRVIVVAFKEGLGGELNEVLVACEVPGKKSEVAVLLLRMPTVRVLARGKIDFAAHDGVDPHGAALLVKVYRPEHVPVVGQGQGAAVARQVAQELGRSAAAILETDEAIDERVFGMVVEMHESRSCHKSPQSSNLNPASASVMD
jgi:hypothetical protein